MKPYTLLILVILLNFCNNSASAQRVRDEDDPNYRKATKEERLEKRKKRLEHWQQHNQYKVEVKAEKRKRNPGPQELDHCHIMLSYGVPVSLVMVPILFSYDRYARLSSPESYGAVSLSCKYYTANRFALGLIGNLEFLHGTINNGYASPYNAVGKYTERIITVAPELTFAIVAKRKGLFYSSLAIGYSAVEKKFTYDQDSYNASYYNGVTRETNGESSEHITANLGAGLRFGRKIGGFMEVNLGFKGLFCCGLSFKL